MRQWDDGAVSTAPAIRSGRWSLSSRWGVALVLLVLALSGCGYALVGRASNLPADITTMHVRAFENETSRIQVDQILTRAVIDELVTRKRYQLVGEDDGPDATISGRVVSFGVTPLTIDAEGRATEYQITIVTAVELRDQLRDEVIWSNDSYQFRETYPIDDVDEAFIEQETEALEEAAERFAETVVTDLLEGF